MAYSKICKICEGSYWYYESHVCSEFTSIFNTMSTEDIQDSLDEVPKRSSRLNTEDEKAFGADFAEEMVEWESSTMGNEFGSTDCEEFKNTCAARHNSGKVQIREVDPAFIIGLGEVLTSSREKYDEGNWQKETKLSTPYESAMRHLMKYWSGESIDEETNCHHLLHAATNLMFLYYHETSGKGIDDRLFKKDKK